VLDQLQAIKLQEVLRHSTYSRLRQDQAPLQSKMSFPAIAARVKQPNEPAGLDIDGRKIASLVAVARQAGPRQVALLGLTTMPGCNNVVGFVWEESVLFVK
jgi:hypothetical protein